MRRSSAVMSVRQNVSSERMLWKVRSSRGLVRSATMLLWNSRSASQIAAQSSIAHPERSEPPDAGRLLARREAWT